MQLIQITDERSASEALKGVVAGNKLRITFKLEAGSKLYERFEPLRNMLNFDFEWLVLVNNSFAITDGWGRHSRTQDFTVTRMSPSNREVLAFILSDITESIEIL